MKISNTSSIAGLALSASAGGKQAAIVLPLKLLPEDRLRWRVSDYSPIDFLRGPSRFDVTSCRPSACSSLVRPSWLWQPDAHTRPAGRFGELAQATRIRRAAVDASRRCWPHEPRAHLHLHLAPLDSLARLASRSSGLASAAAPLAFIQNGRKSDGVADDHDDDDS